MTEFLKKIFGVRKYLFREYEKASNQSKILDIGCFGFVQYENTNIRKSYDFIHYGIDYMVPKDIPKDFTFYKCDVDREKIPFEDNFFDIVVASHVIEHLHNPLNMISEALRVCKPNGLIYIEAPSERTIFLPGMSFKHEGMHCISFFDDPTHLGRPWSPQSLHRAAHYFDAMPVKVGYYKSWLARLVFLFTFPFLIIFRKAKLYEFLLWHSVGWAAYALIKKKDNTYGSQDLNYFIPK